MLPEFDLLMPKTLPEALEMLAEGAPDVVPLAGGTGLLVDMRGGLRRPGLLVNVAGLDELHGVRREDGHVVVGGGVTIAGLLDDPLIARHASVLRDGAAVFANPLVRNRATVGGNLVYASPAADTAPPLLVLEAEVELVSKEGSRRVPLEDFITGVRETVRRPDELLAAVRWPLPAPHSAGAFHKLALRKADAISVLSVAVMVEGDGVAPPTSHRGEGGGYCQQARIALGAAAPRPIRAHAAEEVLRGQPLTPEVIAEAARLSAECAAPIDDVRGSAAYRRRVVGVLVRRLLTEVARNQVFS
jgi:CO/xanthine dehydrogenase FAD-binding subunit